MSSVLIYLENDEQDHRLALKANRRCGCLGSRRDLGLIMSAYVPSVSCLAPVGVAALGSCSDIIDLMPVGRNVELFGHHGRSGPHLDLPDTFYSGETKGFEFPLEVC